MNKKNQKGFTLVELIVVIAIVAILAAVGIVGYTQFIQNARNSKAKTELDQVVNVLYAQAIVEGIRVESTEEEGVTTYKVVESGGDLVVEVVGGKVVFADGILKGQFEAVMKLYAEDLTGELTLTKDKLTYKVDEGTATAAVTYSGSAEDLVYKP